MGVLPELRRTHQIVIVILNTRMSLIPGLSGSGSGSPPSLDPTLILLVKPDQIQLNI